MKTYYILDPDTNTWSRNHLPLREIVAMPGVTGNHLLANARTQQTQTVAEALASARKPTAPKAPTVPLLKLPPVKGRTVTAPGAPGKNNPKAGKTATAQIKGGKGKRIQYKVLGHQDECFGNHFNAATLELVLNSFAQQGWKVLSCLPPAAGGSTASAPADLLIVMERKVAAAPC